MQDAPVTSKTVAAALDSSAKSWNASVWKSERQGAGFPSTGISGKLQSPAIRWPSVWTSAAQPAAFLGSVELRPGETLAMP